MAELLSQDGAPVMRAQARVGLRHQLVKEPHVDEVEELRKKLMVRAALTRHRRRRDMAPVSVWRTSSVEREKSGPLMQHKQKQ